MSDNIAGYQFQILLAMNRLGKHVYGGTVSQAEADRRHTKNKIARKQRKVNNSK